MKYFQKSWEGTFFFFCVAFFIALAMFEDWRIALVGALIGAMVELFSLEVDDNLTVPIGSALALSLALLLFHLV
jgi:dolichol kinase